MRYPPYNDKKMKWMRWFVEKKRTVPSVGTPLFYALILAFGVTAGLITQVRLSNIYLLLCVLIRDSFSLLTLYCRKTEIHSATTNPLKQFQNNTNFLNL